MTSRSRDVMVNILCGTMSGMRPAPQEEIHQYQVNTQTDFDLLVVSAGGGVSDAHVAKSGFSGAFDFDRIKRYDNAWFDMKGADLLKGTALSEIYDGKTINDPFVARAVETMREHVPEYAGKLAMHGTAFPAMALDMAADYVDRATFTDQTLSLEKAANLRSLFAALSVSSKDKEVAPYVNDKVGFYDLVAEVDKEMAGFESSAIKGLSDDPDSEIDYTSVPTIR